MKMCDVIMLPLFKHTTYCTARYAPSFAARHHPDRPHQSGIYSIFSSSPPHCSLVSILKALPYWVRNPPITSCYLTTIMLAIGCREGSKIFITGHVATLPLNIKQVSVSRAPLKCKQLFWNRQTGVLFICSDRPTRKLWQSRLCYTFHVGKSFVSSIY